MIDLLAQKRLPPPLHCARRMAEVAQCRSLTLTGMMAGDPLSGEAVGKSGKDLLGIRWWTEKRRRTDDRTMVDVFVYEASWEWMNMKIQSVIPAADMGRETQRKRFAQGVGNRLLEMKGEQMKTQEDLDNEPDIGSWMNDPDIRKESVEKQLRELEQNDE